jgi:hypothetical protein
MNDTQKLKYFDDLFSSGGQIIKGEAVKWARQNNVNFRNITVDDYFELLLAIIGLSKNDLTQKQWEDFKEELWKGIEWGPELLKVGQVVRLINKRFTCNLYVITQLDPLGFNVYNRRLAQYRFNDLDYSSIDKIIDFNF